MKEELIEELIIDKPEIAAVFHFKISCLKENFEIQPFLKAHKLVAWTIRGKGIMKCLQEIYSDTPIPINSYLRSLREVRSQIFVFQNVDFTSNKS